MNELIRNDNEVRRPCKVNVRDQFESIGLEGKERNRVERGGANGSLNRNRSVAFNPRGADNLDSGFHPFVVGIAFTLEQINSEYSG
jgi:hypothetical protein